MLMKQIYNLVSEMLLSALAVWIYRYATFVYICFNG